MKNDAHKIIEILKRGGFYADCPGCGEPVALRQAEMFYNDEFTSQADELYRQKLQAIADRKKKLRELRRLIGEKSERTSLAVNIGYILERIAPTLKGFHFRHTDCRSIFDPIDYVVFDGLSAKGRVSRIIFTDIKTGAARLSAKQRQIKQAVETGKVEWKTYRPEGK